MSVRSESSSVTTVALEELIVYPKRWVVLSIFSLMTFANQAMWVTFVPISDVAAEYLSATTTQVNWLSIVWLVLYLPGTYIQALILEKYDLRTVVVFGGFLTLLGAALRVFASLLNLYVGIGDNWRYALQLLGSAIAGIVQPIFLNLPGNISSAWFAPGERDVSTTLASVCGPVGCAVGSILPSAFVSLDMSDRVMDRNFLNLFLCELAMCAVGFLPLYQYFESCPPTPPSESERVRKKLLETEKERASEAITAALATDLRNSASAYSGDRGSIGTGMGMGMGMGMGGSRGDDSAMMREHGGVWSPPPVPPSQPSAMHGNGHNSGGGGHTTGIPGLVGPVWAQLVWLSRNWNYMLLFTTFTIGLGVMNLMLTLVNQIVEPYGYDNDQAGYCNAALLVTGLIGAGITSKVLETYKAYNTVIKVGFIGILISIVLIIVSLHVSFALLLTGFAMLGFFMLPLLPCVIECTAEITYPYVSEDVAVGFIFVSGNLTGAAFAFLGEYLLTLDDHESAHVSPFAQPSNIFIFAGTLVCVTTAMMFKGTYSRLGMDYAIDEDSHDNNGDNQPLMRGGGGGDDATPSMFRSDRKESGGNSSSLWSFPSMFSGGIITPTPKRLLSTDSSRGGGGGGGGLGRPLLLGEDVEDNYSHIESSRGSSRQASKDGSSLSNNGGNGNSSILSTMSGGTGGGAGFATHGNGTSNPHSDASVSYRASSQRETMEASHSPIKQALNKLSPGREGGK